MSIWDRLTPLFTLSLNIRVQKCMIGSEGGGTLGQDRSEEVHCLR